MFSNTSNLTNPVDEVFVYIAGVSLVMLVLVTGCMIFFAVRYAKKRSGKPENVQSSTLLEISWVVIPTILVLSMFFYGWRVYHLMKTPPADAMVVKATARQWSWLFEYPNGARAGELTVPVGRAVRVEIRSADVIHGFSIPAFRVKQDAVPGAETQAWFIAERAGAYDLFCSMYCGEGHSRMLSRVIALPGPDFDVWYRTNAPGVAEGSAAERGHKLAQEHGCLGCHSTDGSRLVGPTFKGLYAREVEVVTGGKERKLTADDAYVRRSLLFPKEDITKGYPDAMPSFQGALSDRDIADLTEYLKGLR